MRDAYRGLGLVDVLATCAGRAVRVDLQLLGPDLDLRVVLDLRRRVDERERGLAAFLEIEGRDPHQAVRAALGLEISVGVRTLDRQRGATDAGLITGCRLDDVGPESVPLRPTHVHAHEHLRPVSGIRSTDARGDRQYSVALVVRTAELRFETGLVDLGEQLLELALEVGAERRVLGHRCELGEVRGAPAKGVPALDARAHEAEALHDLLRALPVVPEVGRGGLSL